MICPPKRDLLCIFMSSYALRSPELAASLASRSADVPHDVPTGPSASIQDLAIFAWREFIALNWVAMDPATTGIRARPNLNLGANGGLFR